MTCCANHLTRFALVPAEYLEIVKGVQEGRGKQADGADDINMSLSDSGRGLNIKYLVGCICAFLTLVATLFCLGKQIFAFKTEKKRYEQLVRDNQNREEVMPTERALITNDDAKPTHALDDSPKRNIESRMRSSMNVDSNDDKPLELKFSKEKIENDHEDFLQIEDQDEKGGVSTKKSFKPPTGKAQDVSSIMEKFDSVDHGDKTLKEVRNLFDDKTSRATPKATPTPPNLKIFDATTKSAKFVDESYNMVNLKEKPEHKRVQSAVTTCGLMSSHAPDDSAFEVPHKSSKKQRKQKQKKSLVSREASKTDTNATEPITPNNNGEVQNKNDVEDMI